MSRMTKLLKQSCVFTPAVRTNGIISFDQYGEPTYGTAVTLRCRKEYNTKDVLTLTGSILRSETVFYTDESQVVRTDDLLDGNKVLGVKEFINALGLVEGYKSYA